MRVQLLWSSHIDTNVFALKGHCCPVHLNGTFWCRSDAYEHVKKTLFDVLGMDPGSGFFSLLGSNVCLFFYWVRYCAVDLFSDIGDFVFVWAFPFVWSDHHHYHILLLRPTGLSHLVGQAPLLLSAAEYQITINQRWLNLREDTVVGCAKKTKLLSPSLASTQHT